MATDQGERPHGAHDKVPRMTPESTSVFRLEYRPDVGNARYLAQTSIIGQWPELRLAPVSAADLATTAYPYGQQELANTIGQGATQGSVQQAPPYQEWPGSYLPSNEHEGAYDQSVLREETQAQSGFEDLQRRIGNAAAPVPGQPVYGADTGFIDEAMHDIAHPNKWVAQQTSNTRPDMGVETNA